jgi:hypothetical protein
MGSWWRGSPILATAHGAVALHGRHQSVAVIFYDARG